MDKKKTVSYEIAGVCLKISAPWEEKISQAFAPFVRTEGEESWKVEFSPVENIVSTGRSHVFENSVFRVYERSPGIFERQYYNDRTDGSPYVSVITDTNGKRVYTDYLPEAEEKFGTGEADFFCIAFERILMEEQAMILHAALVDTPYGGILFAGHSGAGKSTQADLWCRSGKGKLLNGDRPILKEGADGFFAYGSPYAGSSGCHLNESCRVRMIVFVKQAKTCQLKELSSVEKFRKVFGNLTVNLWDQEFVSKAGAFTQRMIEKVPIYEFQCTKESEAVTVLEQFLIETKEI